MFLGALRGSFHLLDGFYHSFARTARNVDPCLAKGKPKRVFISDSRISCLQCEPGFCERQYVMFKEDFSQREDTSGDNGDISIQGGEYLRFGGV